MNTAKRLTKLQRWIHTMTADEKKRCAQSCGTSPAYLWQIKGGFSIPGPKLALRLAAFSGGHITPGHVRPDLFGAAQAATITDSQDA